MLDVDVLFLWVSFMRALCLCLGLVIWSVTAQAASPDDKGLLCTNQTVADEGGANIDRVIAEKFFAVWFEQGAALRTVWRRQNDTIVIHSVSAGSRYRTNSRAIDWTSKTLVDGQTRENNYIVDRQSLALNISSTISALAYECELIETKRSYDDALDDTRQILQAAYDKELATNKL